MATGVRKYQKNKIAQGDVNIIQSIDIFLIIKSKQILNYKAMVTTKTCKTFGNEA